MYVLVVFKLTKVAERRSGMVLLEGRADRRQTRASLMLSSLKQAIYSARLSHQQKEDVF